MYAVRRIGIAAVLMAALLMGCDGDHRVGCCRVCNEGQPCGDFCIAADRTCDLPPGCACSKE
jgi:hypothetical protein